MNIRYAFFLDVYRPFFMGGIIFAILAITMWLLHLLDIIPYALPLAQTRIHMAQMVYFFFPFFLIGFLLTVFPRLLSVPSVLILQVWSGC